MFTVSGQRVELHPATDAWMSGDRYGEIIDINDETGNYKVQMDKSGEIHYVHPRNVYKYL